MNTINYPRIVVWITIIQFVCTLAFYAYTLVKITGNGSSAEPEKGFVKKTKAYVAQIKENYKQKADLYEQRIDSLQERLTITETALSKAKASSKRDRSILTDMLNRKWDTLSPEQKSWECDTLRDQVEHYLFTAGEKDSLYEQKVKEHELIETNLSRQLASCDTTQEILASKLDESLAQNKAVTKEMKKQKRRKNLAKVGAFVLGGLAVYFAVH